MSVATWQVLIALLPFVLVLYHALNLSRGRLKPPPGFKQGDMTEKLRRLWRKPKRLPKKLIGQRLRSAETSIGAIIQEQYGWGAILARYIFPAALIPIVGMIAFRIVNHPSAWFQLNGDEHLMAFEYGLAGAYFFIFLELGKRSVRNDITPVSILWCLITLVIGPTLAALIPSVFVGTVTGNWNNRALWIVAGYSPRLVFRTLAQGTMKALQVESSVTQEERRIPLGRIEGIGAEEIERLAEEGITDAHALACVEPVRLMRDTRFDNWRILSWVDQALLLSCVPEDIWRELIKRGYQGATDIKILVRKEPPNWPLRVLNVSEADEILTEIADSAKLSPKILRDLLARLVEDPRTGNFEALAKALAHWPERPPGPTLVPKGSPTESPDILEGKLVKNGHRSLRCVR